MLVFNQGRATTVTTVRLQPGRRNDGNQENIPYFAVRGRPCRVVRGRRDADGAQPGGQLVHFLGTSNNFSEVPVGTGLEQFVEADNGHRTVTSFAKQRVSGDRHHISWQLIS